MKGLCPRQILKPRPNEAVPAVISDKDTTKRQIVPQKKSVPAVKSTQGGAVRNFVEKALQFLREVKVELKKVTWPSRKQTHRIDAGGHYTGDNHFTLFGGGRYRLVEPDSFGF